MAIDNHNFVPNYTAQPAQLAQERLDMFCYCTPDIIAGLETMSRTKIPVWNPPWLGGGLGEKNDKIEKKMPAERVDTW